MNAFLCVFVYKDFCESYHIFILLQEKNESRVSFVVSFDAKAFVVWFCATGPENQGKVS